jgi:hypothetical protein
MRYINSKVNILINIALCLCVFILAICGAELVLRRITIEGLSGHKMYVGEVDSKFYLSSIPNVVKENKIFKFDLGNCYPSNTTGHLPLKVINPNDGKYWYCVYYDKKQRHQGYNPDRKRQITIVGDSFVFGNGVKEAHTLGYLLNEHFPKINFQNWGKKGANIDDVAEKCKEIIESVPAVDEVIYFYNLNDVRMSKMVSSQQKHIFDFQNIHWDYNEEPYGTLERLLSKSALFSLVRKMWVIKRESSLTVQNYRDMYLSESNRQEFLSTMDEIRSIKDMLAAHGISFRMIIYPLLYKDLLGRYPFEQIHEVIISECHKRGVTCLDGYVPFKSYYSLKRFTVHPLDYHPNGLSNRELVDYIHKKNFVIDRPE